LLETVVNYRLVTVVNYCYQQVMQRQLLQKSKYLNIVSDSAVLHSIVSKVKVYMCSERVLTSKSNGTAVLQT